MTGLWEATVPDCFARTIMTLLKQLSNWVGRSVEEPNFQHLSTSFNHFEPLSPMVRGSRADPWRPGLSWTAGRCELHGSSGWIDPVGRGLFVSWAKRCRSWIAHCFIQDPSWLCHGSENRGYDTQKWPFYEILCQGPRENDILIYWNWGYSTPSSDKRIWVFACDSARSFLATWQGYIRRRRIPQFPPSTEAFQGLVIGFHVMVASALGLNFQPNGPMMAHVQYQLWIENYQWLWLWMTLPSFPGNLEGVQFPMNLSVFFAIQNYGVFWVLWVLLCGVFCHPKPPDDLPRCCCKTPPINTVFLLIVYPHIVLLQEGQMQPSTNKYTLW